MGSRGIGASKKSVNGLLGSVSDYCVHHCVSPVVVVRSPEDKDGEDVVSVSSGMHGDQQDEDDASQGNQGN